MGLTLGFAGTLDMMTNGHLWVIQEAAKMADHVVILLPENPAKTPLTPVDRRKELIEQALFDAKIYDITVGIIKQEYTARAAQRMGINYMIRGIRSASEFDYEKQLNHTNVHEIGGVSTIFVVPPNDVAHISSSYVKSMMGSSPIGWHNEVQKLVPPVIYNHLRDKWLLQQWLSIWPQNEDAATWWAHVTKQYNGKDRYYHNLDHIVHMLTELDAWAANTNADPKALTTLKRAAWFHDVIYHTAESKTGTSEELSAQFWEGCQLIFHADEDVTPVATLIRITNHFQAKTLSHPLMDVMLGADLAILGQPAHLYDEYAVHIREEYSSYGELEYTRGRLDALQTLSKGTIFKDPYFFAKYEADAVANIAREITTLRARLARMITV